jgi:hypothetical protein
LLQELSDRFGYWHASRSEFIQINQQICASDKKQARYESWGQEAAQHLASSEGVGLYESKLKKTKKHYAAKADKLPWWMGLFGIAENGRKDMFVSEDILPTPNRSQNNR